MFSCVWVIALALGELRITRSDTIFVPLPLSYVLVPNLFLVSLFHSAAYNFRVFFFRVLVLYASNNGLHSETKIRPMPMEFPCYIWGVAELADAFAARLEKNFDSRFHFLLLPPPFSCVFSGRGCRRVGRILGGIGVNARVFILL